MEPHEVDRALSEGDEIDAGGITLRVLHTPGHTLGHVSLWAPEEGVLILGDAVHGDDVSWINPFREGVGGIVRALETLDRLSELPVRRAYSGHGPMIEDLADALSAAKRRYERWLDEPEKAYWHACKRIFAYALMVYGGMTERELRAYLLRCPWFDDYARHGFGVELEEFLQPLLAEMLRSKAAAWRERRLVASAATTPHRRAGPRDPSDLRTGPRLEDLGKLRLDGDGAAVKRYNGPEAIGGSEPCP